MTTHPENPASPLSEAWVAYITPFADTVGKSVEEVTALLQPIVGTPGDQAIALLKDASMASDADIKGVLTGVPTAVVNKAIKSLREAVTVSPSAAAMALNVGDILPSVPGDESWLSALRAGGVLKIDQSTVISAIRAALAHRVNLFEIPEMLARRMEQFADENAEPVPEEFFKLRKQLTRRSYADIFEAIEGLDGTFVTDARKNQLLGRIDANLWPSIVSFQTQLKAWVDSWQQGAANPAMLMNAVMAVVGGGGVGAMPPGMMAPPDTGTLRDQAEAFNDEINKVFAGTGIQIASALAFDASRIKQILENQRLPALIGAANRDQMLRQMGVEVSATYPRLEANLIKYALAIMKVKDVAAGNEELQYFGSLYMLGSQIPWDQLGMGKRATRLSQDADRRLRTA
ncbi:hypothetical protein FJY93_04900 [Candidatus Kaiserbacteria bacterium]|nr:hypothetical protein [Candidatus Kaiserbacteria bacterium]